MKKIASARENSEIFKIKATCSGSGWDQGSRVPCYSLWEVSAADIQKRTYTDYGGSTDAYYGFTCPECGCFTELDKNEIPATIRNSARLYIDPTKQDDWY